MLRVLEAALRLAHPLIPFVTEELWQKVAPMAGMKETETVMLAKWPVPDPAKVDEAAEAQMAALMEAVRAARELRGDLDIPAGDRPELIVCGAAADSLEWARAHIAALCRPAG